MDQAALKLSLLICTYNRAAFLEDTLASILESRFPSWNMIEIIVVDNNSSDRTHAVVESFVHNENCGVRYVFEPVQGLSQARNTAIEASLAEYVAFLDDDIYMDDNWLCAVFDIIEKYPLAAAFGGKSVPVFEGGQPDWKCDEAFTAYGSTNSGDEIKRMVYPEHPFGLNMIFKRTVFDEVGGFSTKLGRKKNNLLSGEESDMFYRISAKAMEVIYTPYALVEHRIPSDRAKKEWVDRRFFWQGISEVAFQQMTNPMPRYELLLTGLRSLVSALRNVTGGHINPRSMYWHFRSRNDCDLFVTSLFIGKAKQCFKEVFSYGAK